jgi:hypothetical protein
LLAIAREWPASVHELAGLLGRDYRMQASIGVGNWPSGPCVQWMAELVAILPAITQLTIDRIASKFCHG